MVDVKRLRIEHRQSCLIDEVCKGAVNRRELATKFHVSPATIDRDLKSLAMESARNLDTWVDEKIPFAFTRLFASNDRISKKVWDEYERHEGEDNQLQLERLQFIAALNWQKRNFLVDYDKITLQLHHKKQAKDDGLD